MMRQIFLLICFFILFINSSVLAEIYIRVNQVGFLPNDIKCATILSSTSLTKKQFQIINSANNKVVYRSKIESNFSPYGSFNYSYRIYFSDLHKAGEYYILISGSKSIKFRISSKLYGNIVFELMKFFKIQRCGYTDPQMHKVCHTNDATRIIDDGSIQSYRVDVTGGWHDAADYVKFLNTTAYTTYLMLFAYDFDPEKFGFDYDNNGAPDILEEAKIGLDWLLRANYGKGKLVIQVQDLQDHDVGWRLPENDELINNRPAYVGISKNLIGMYVSTMALGARIWTEKFKYFEFSAKCLVAAEDIYSYRFSVKDIDSTGSGVYFDKSFNGKMALAAIELFEINKKQKYFEEAKKYATIAGSDYWWSWGDINSLAHYKIARYENSYIKFIEENLNHFQTTMDQNVFGDAAEHYWGSNNTLMGISLQALLFKKLTSSSKFDDLALSQRDYVLGKNPWGLSFIFNIGSKYSRNFHHQVAYFNRSRLPGGFAAGPVKKSIIEGSNIPFEKPDKLVKFQTENAYYRDDRQDYISNEPTISANATAIFVMGYFSK